MAADPKHLVDHLLAVSSRDNFLDQTTRISQPFNWGSEKIKLGGS